MSGLTDMEELIATVPEKDIATYLREAFVCYGAGAYRGCIVLVHTALFEGLRMKLQAVSSSNAAAKAVLTVIEPDAAAQKVFEQKLIDQMRVNSIITQLESDILVQLNKQRNKAAHPSGHLVTAEEARFVFSEAIKKFLSQPIRQTSVLVDAIVARLPDPNLFPSTFIGDIALVVSEEISNLDQVAMPELISKLTKVHGGADPKASSNALNFVIALANRKEASTRAALIKQFIAPKSSVDANAEAITTLVTTDPEFLTGLSAGERMRVSALLLKNAEAVKGLAVYQELRHPAHALASMVTALGESVVLNEYGSFVEWIFGNSPMAPGLVLSLSGSPKLLEMLQHQIRTRASSVEFSVANPFATALPTLDAALAQVSTNEEALELLASVARAAGYNAFDARDLVSSHFNATPALKAKAMTALTSDPAADAKALATAGNPAGVTEFGKTYFGMS